MATVTLVSDAFNRADGAIGVADTGQTWLHTGTRKVVVSSNTCVGAVGGNLQDATYIDGGQADITLTAKVWLTSAVGLHSGPVWRLTDGDNYWLASLYYAGGTEYRLYGYKRVAGSWVGLTGSPVTFASSPGDWAECKVVTSGTNTEVYFGGTLRYGVTDDFNATATKVGVLLDAASEKIDDFLVTYEAPDTATTKGGRGSRGKKKAVQPPPRPPRRYQTVIVGDTTVTTRRR